MIYHPAKPVQYLVLRLIGDKARQDIPHKVSNGSLGSNRMKKFFWKIHCNGNFNRNRNISMDGLRWGFFGGGFLVGEWSAVCDPDICV